MVPSVRSAQTLCYAALVALVEFEAELGLLAEVAASRENAAAAEPPGRPERDSMAAAAASDPVRAAGRHEADRQDASASAKARDPRNDEDRGAAGEPPASELACSTERVA